MEWNWFSINFERSEARQISDFLRLFGVKHMRQSNEEENEMEIVFVSIDSKVQ